MGLRTEAAMAMIDRIRDNAWQLDVPLAEDGCSPNLLIVFSTDSLATMQNLVERNPYLFQFLDPDERRDLLQPGPVHVFSYDQVRTRDGMPIPEVRNLVSPPVSQQQMAHSILYTATRRDIASVTIVFDIDDVGGTSIGQLADYATMRGLAQTRPAAGAMNSILSLFNPTGPYPEELTDFDRAYLRAVYSGIPNLPAAMKLGAVNRELDQLAEEARLAQASAQ